MIYNNTGDSQIPPQFFIRQNNDALIIKYLVERCVTENHTLDIIAF